MIQNLTFITGNQHKADFLAANLGMLVRRHKLDLVEIQSLDLHEVVEHKVRQAYDILQTPVLVEDASLTLPAMGKLPGTFIKWFMEELGCEGLHALALGLPSREAIGKVCYGFYDGNELHFFDGEMRGRIADKLGVGTRGFGFDRIFINDGFSVTRSDMSEEDYNQTSYRTDGMVRLREFLTSY